MFFMLPPATLISRASVARSTSSPNGHSAGNNTVHINSRYSSFPNEEYRELIWTVLFPAECPLGDDVDLATLARLIRVAGGNIKNIALSAAFFAAEEGGVIGMPH